MSKAQQCQNFIRYYVGKTGESEINLRKVVQLAVQMGWELPKPTDPMDLLIRQFADAARQEIRHDKNTKRPYRAYHAVPPEGQGKGQMGFWVDIDDPNTTPSNYRKSAVRRREQMVDDGVQLTFDNNHWNSMHPNPEDQVHLPMDITLDVEIRLAVWSPNEPVEV